jgi:hypothetical protein
MEKKEITNIIKNNPQIIDYLGLKLYEKIKDVVNPELTEDVYKFTLQDCLDYIYNLILNQIHYGYVPVKSVIYDGFAKIFPDIIFEETDMDLDYVSDVDYMVRINNKAFGIQIKPVTSKSNFGNYSPSERMKASFKDFEEEFGGKVFIVYSLNDEIANIEVIEDIKKEINRLNK